MHPSPPRPLGPVTVRRRCAAQGTGPVRGLPADRMCVRAWGNLNTTSGRLSEHMVNPWLGCELKRSHHVSLRIQPQKWMITKGRARNSAVKKSDRRCRRGSPLSKHRRRERARLPHPSRQGRRPASDRTARRADRRVPCGSTQGVPSS